MYAKRLRPYRKIGYTADPTDQSRLSPTILCFISSEIRGSSDPRLPLEHRAASSVNVRKWTSPSPFGFPARPVMSGFKRVT